MSRIPRSTTRRNVPIFPSLRYQQRSRSRRIAASGAGLTEHPSTDSFKESRTRARLTPTDFCFVCSNDQVHVFKPRKTPLQHTEKLITPSAISHPRRISSLVTSKRNFVFRLPWVICLITFFISVALMNIYNA